MSDSAIRVIGLVYQGIYEDHVEVELAGQRRTYRLPVMGAVQGQRVARMKRSAAQSVPPNAKNGDLPIEFAQEVKCQLEKMP